VAQAGQGDLFAKHPRLTLGAESTISLPGQGAKRSGVADSLATAYRRRICGGKLPRKSDTSERGVIAVIVVAVVITLAVLVGTPV
jgi:hypothetical protein